MCCVRAAARWRAGPCCVGKHQGVISISSLARLCGRCFSRTASSTGSMALHPNQLEGISEWPLCLNQVLLGEEPRFQMSECRSCGRVEQMELTSPCLCRARLPSGSNSRRTSFTFKLQSVRERDKQLHMEALCDPHSAISDIFMGLIQAKKTGKMYRLHRQAAADSYLL